MITAILVLLFLCCEFCTSQAIESSEHSVESAQYEYVYPDPAQHEYEYDRYFEQTPCHETHQCLLDTLGDNSRGYGVDPEFVYNSTKYSASDVENCMLPCEAEFFVTQQQRALAELRALIEGTTLNLRKLFVCLQRAEIRSISEDLSTCLGPDYSHWNILTGTWEGGGRYKRHVDNDNNKRSRVGAYSVGGKSILHMLTLSHTNELLNRCPQAASESVACIDRVTNGQFQVPDVKEVFTRVCELAKKCDPEGRCSAMRVEFDRARCECVNRTHQLVKAAGPQCGQHFLTFRQMMCPADEASSQKSSLLNEHHAFEHRCNIGEPLTFDEMIDGLFSKYWPVAV